MLPRPQIIFSDVIKTFFSRPRP